MEKAKAIIDRFEGDKGVLIFNDGQQLIVNKIDFKQEVHEGDTVYLDFKIDQVETENQVNLAKSILQEILKNNAANTTT
jgi:hypothetical protein